MMPNLEIAVRLACFVGAFVALACLEHAFPRRPRVLPRRIRWSANLGVSVVDQLVIRLFVPVSAVLMATHSSVAGQGLLNIVSLPGWLAVIIAVLVLDLTLYLQHRLFHAVPLLWRLHRMHHADTELDLTTGIRFHPVSMLLSAFIKLGVVFLLGPPVLAVLVFEVLLNATSLFNHANLAISPALEKILRTVVVTPGMHRVHHSTDPRETNSNFGFNFPWWDRWFATYTSEPRLGHERMRIGLEEFRGTHEQNLRQMLTQPWRNPRA